MAKWSADSGILRKRPPEKHEDLLVFGYACKLFRDDEKAIYIDQGKHLIPWMGDDSLKIDRYDCRGALSDLTTCEASREGYDAMRWLGLNESERRLEQLCDEERYYFLHKNEEEEELYKEEELKRLCQSNKEFQYSYDNVKEDKPEEELKEHSVEEEPYSPPSELDVPVDIAVPKTKKESARIEKTALFVSRQGPQMEILIKAKQADNPQFAFLNQSDSLHKFYRHVLNAVKSGKYKIVTETEEDQRKDETHDSETQDGDYLHPSLSSVMLQQPAPLPAVPYRPSADCAYSQLVNRIQGSNSSNATDKPSQLSYEQQYWQYYYAQQYYEYCKQLSQHYQEDGSLKAASAQSDEALHKQYLNLQMAYTQYMQHHQHQQQQQQLPKPPDNPYAQIVSNLNKDGPSNPYTALVESLQQNLGVQQQQNSSEIEKAAVMYGKEAAVEDNRVVTKEVKEREENQQSGIVISKKPLSFLADYGSDSEDSESESVAEVQVKVPPEDVCIIIDKMASYVSKNGGDFEKIVKAKGDPRFDFLNDNHEYNTYYRSKIEEFMKEEEKGKAKENGEADGDNSGESPPAVKVKEKKVITPVSFSIKKPKEEQSKEIKSALPVEESSDEETPTATEPTETVKPVSNPNEKNSDNCLESPVTQNDNAETSKKTTLDPDDPILEMIDLTDELEEKKDAKRAEDRIKDKLAAAAREKLASVSRDRALQAERRKKATAFIKMKAAPKTVPAVVPTTTTETTTTATETERTEKRGSRRRSSEDGGGRSSKKMELPQQKDSEPEEGEIRKHKSKKRKSHKRKRSKSKQESKSKKKSKKRRRKSQSRSSCSSNSP